MLIESIAHLETKGYLKYYHFNKQNKNEKINFQFIVDNFNHNKL